MLEPELPREALQPRALGAVADDEVAQARVAVAQDPQRADDVPWRLRVTRWATVTSVGSGRFAGRTPGMSVPSRTTVVRVAPSLLALCSIPREFASTTAAVA